MAVDQTCQSIAEKHSNSKKLVTLTMKERIQSLVKYVLNFVRIIPAWKTSDI